jgi:choline dehydrogenase
VFALVPAGELIPGDAVTDDALPEVIASNLANYAHPTSTVPMGGPGDPCPPGAASEMVRNPSSVKMALVKRPRWGRLPGTPSRAPRDA